MRGDREARELVFARLYPRVLAQARALCPTGADAEDLAQNALLAACRHLAQLRDSHSLSGWVSRIVQTTYLLSLRRRRFAPLPQEETPLEEGTAAGDERDPIDRLSARHTVDAVLAAIAKLSDGLREVLCLRVFENHTTRETARILGISEGAVRTRLKRARQEVRLLAAR